MPAQAPAEYAATPPAAKTTTRLLLTTIPEWGHLSPCLLLADSIRRAWPASNGTLQLAVASMEHVRAKVEARGIDFVSVGCWDSEEEAQQYAALSQATFDPRVPLMQKMQQSSVALFEMTGLKMGQALLQHLAAAKEAGELPDVIVNDGLTSAGFDAAEKFELPLAVVYPFPLSMSLQLAGYPGHNMPPSVPLEFLHLATSEHAHPLVKSCINPLIKRAAVWLMQRQFSTDSGGRAIVRRQLGLPPLQPPVLRDGADGSSSGQLNSSGGPLAVQPSVPRAIYLAGVTWELNAMRELPPGWHIVGALVVDRQAGDFPPAFGPEDKEVEAFLQAAADAGEPVVFTAAGSMTHLTQQQVDALLDTFFKLAGDNSSSNGSSDGSSHKHKSSSYAAARPVRVLWALRAESQQLLPEHLRSSNRSNSSVSKQVAAAEDAAAGSDAATTVGANTTSSGSSGSSGSSNGSSRILVSSWVKQTAVLAHPAVKVFVTHGGLGSVHEALALGQAVPLVVPFSNSADHVIIGQQIASRGLGALLKPSQLLKPGRLLKAVQELLGRPEYARRVAATAQAWEKLGYGPGMAADMLVEFATHGKSV